MCAAVTAVLLAAGGAVGRAQFYDGSNTTYGKNRLQHKDFFWQYYPAGDFNVFHYQGGAELARRVVRALPSVRAEVEAGVKAGLASALDPRALGRAGAKAGSSVVQAGLDILFGGDRDDER